MKKLFIFPFLIAFFACNSQKSANKNSIKQEVIATYESWVAGIQGGGSGIRFTITLKNKLPENMQLVSVIFKGYEVPLVPQSELNYQASIRTASNQKADEPASTSPKNDTKLADNEAILLYLVDGKAFQHKIDHVKRIETLHYPNSKPKN